MLQTYDAISHNVITASTRYLNIVWRHGYGVIIALLFVRYFPRGQRHIFHKDCFH